MSNTTFGSVALIVDDEPEYLGWVSEYLATFGVRAEFARSLPEALRAIDAKRFAVILIDLEIPAPGASEHLSRARSPAIQKYPGIAVVIHALNQGYRSPRVIVYSVHDDEAAGAELRKMDCPYVLKGRAEVLKRIIGNLLQASSPRSAPKQAGTPGHRRRKHGPSRR